MSGLGGSFSQSSEFSNGIPPVLLKNFNANEILKPTKVENSSSRALSEDLLIDFESPLEVNRTEKEDEGFTVIDVYQNIYVTPQLVNNKPNTTIETDVDYADFSRKLESSNKVNLTQNSRKVQPQTSLLDFNIDEISEPQYKISTNNDPMKYTVCSNNYETYEYQEELIDELLLDRSLEKLKISNIKSEETPNDIKVLSTPKISKDIPFHDAISWVPKLQRQNTDSPKTHDDIKYNCPKMYPHWKDSDNIPTMGVYCSQDKNDRVYLNTNIPSSTNFNYLTSKDTKSNSSYSVTASKISNNVSNNQIPLDNPTRSSDQRFNISIDHLKLSSTADQYYNKNIKPIRKDTYFSDDVNRLEKTLNDEKILNSLKILNNVHNNHIHPSNKIDSKPQQSYHDYTKLYPQTVPLHTDFTKLSSNVYGNNKSKESISTSANVTEHAKLNVLLSKVTNVDHLRKLKSAVNDPQPQSFVSDINALINLTVNPEIMNTMSLQTVIKDNKDYARNRITKSSTEKLQYTKGPDFNEKSIILPQLLKRLGEQKKEREAQNNVKKRLVLCSDKIGAKTVHEQASVVLEPTTLMEDCNKERLVALKTRQNLSNLVQSGYL